MTAFDYAAGLLLLASGVVGLVRGATREVTTVLALFLAAASSLFLLRYTGPLARHAIHIRWLADAAAVLAAFVVIYIALRLIGGALTAGVQGAGLSGLDRGLGFAIGLARAVVLLGAFAMALQAVTPGERMPRWIAKARLYPLADASGAALRTFAPEGRRMARNVAPVLEQAVAGEMRGSPSDAAGSRRPLDNSVEDTR